jgi:hypothetical protein
LPPDLTTRIAKAKDADPKKFFDDSFVREMQIELLHRLIVQVAAESLVRFAVLIPRCHRALPLSVGLAAGDRPD